MPQGLRPNPKGVNTADFLAKEKERADSKLTAYREKEAEKAARKQEDFSARRQTTLAMQASPPASDPNLKAFQEQEAQKAAKMQEEIVAKRKAFLANQESLAASLKSKSPVRSPLRPPVPAATAATPAPAPTAAPAPAEPETPAA